MKARLRFTILPLILIILLGLGLRLRWWPDCLPFDFEKVRDLVASQNIFLERKLTLIGPTTEVEGIFHGPLYYYLIGFFYFLTQGDPRAASVVSFGFNLFSVLVIYYIAKEIFDRRTGLLAALLYAVSFKSVCYAYWLSNPGPAVPFIFLAFFFFYKFLRSGGRYLSFSLFCLGMAIQFQILNLIFFPSLIVLYLWGGKRKTSGVDLIKALVAFLIPVSSYLLFDLRHDFLMTRNFLAKIVHPYFTQSGRFQFSFLLDYLIRWFQDYAFILFPTLKVLGLPLGLAVLGVIARQFKTGKSHLGRFFLVWLFSTLPMVFLPSTMRESSAVFIGLEGAVVILFAYLLRLLFDRAQLLAGGLTALLLLSNFFAVNYHLTDPQKKLFDDFGGLFLKTDLEVIDYVFEQSQGGPFKVDTVTSPLFISPLWDYLLSWRGRTKYHFFPTRDDQAPFQFLIIEPHLGSSERYKEMAIEKANQKTSLVESRYFGLVLVEKRILKKG